MRRSRFCASLLERRQCERAELDRSVVSLDHDRTRLGLVRIAGDRRQSLDLFAVDESFPVQHDRDVAPDQPDVVGLPLAWTIGNIKGTIGNIKGRSLAAVDGTGLSDPTLTLCDSPISAAAQSRAADYGSTKTYVNRSTRVQRATSTRDDARHQEGRTHPSQGCHQQVASTAGGPSSQRRSAGWPRRGAARAGCETVPPRAHGLAYSVDRFRTLDDDASARPPLRPPAVRRR